MTIKLGEININKIYYGTIPIVHAYLGNELLTGEILNPIVKTLITWINRLNVEIAPDEILTKISGGDAWNARARSQEQTDGTTHFVIEFIAPTIAERIAFGLEEGRDIDDYGNKDIDYSFEINPDGQNEINVNGTNQFRGTYIAGDIFRVALENKIVRFYQNDKMIWQTAGEVSDFPMVADCSIRYQNTTLKLNLYEGKISDSIPDKPVVQVQSLTNQVRLDWTLAENTSSYDIYRSEVNGNLGEKLVSDSIITNTYLDATALGGTTYYYTLQVKYLRNFVDSNQVQAFPYSILVYGNKIVDFEGQTAWSVYDEAKAMADFGNEFTLQGGDRLKIDTSEDYDLNCLLEW